VRASGTVSGYTISNLHYALNATTPGNIDSLTFTVAPVIPSTGTGKVLIQADALDRRPDAYTCTTTRPARPSPARRRRLN
jgi:hypothetical protein